MKTEKYSQSLLKQLLISLLSNLKEVKIEEVKIILDFKMRLLHSIEFDQKDKLRKDLTTILKNNKYSLSTIKLLYLIQYKDKIDHQQIKRTAINNFLLLNSESASPEVYFENHTLFNLAYRNTYYINNLYQLHKIKYYLNEDKAIS